MTPHKSNANCQKTPIDDEFKSLFFWTIQLCCLQFTLLHPESCSCCMKSDSFSLHDCTGEELCSLEAPEDPHRQPPRHRAAIVLLDRRLDLSTPTHHSPHIVDRMFGLLPKPSTAQNSATSPHFHARCKFMSMTHTMVTNRYSFTFLAFMEQICSGKSEIRVHALQLCCVRGLPSP